MILCDIMTHPSRAAEATRTHTHHVSRGKRTIQSRLTDESFATYCDGYEEITHLDLYKVSLGGRIRYITEELNDAGEVLDTHYRLGGILIKVDIDLRYITLKNAHIDPRSTKQGEFNKRTWSCQLKTPNTKVRLFYLAPASNDEVVAFRNLLKDIDSGKLELRVKGSKSSSKSSSKSRSKSKLT